MLVANAVNPPYKQKTINKIKAYLSVFITDTQLSTVCDVVVADTLALKNTSVMASDVMDVVMNSLTTNQMMSGMSIMTCLTNAFGSMSNAMKFLPPVTAVAGNNLTPFLNQVLAKNAQMASNGKGITAKTESMYMMMNQFATITRVGTILQRVKTNSMTPGNWTLFNKCIGTIIFFSKYNLV
uniref:Uncharacterized protein n=1 Tax=Ditylenchus dipsaci TaxID=166011 RepID=A0A915DJW9_9BILA